MVTRWIQPKKAIEKLLKIVFWVYLFLQYHLKHWMPKILIRVIWILLHRDAAADFLWTLGINIGFGFRDCCGGQIFVIHRKPTISGTRRRSARLLVFIIGGNFWPSSWFKYIWGFWSGTVTGCIGCKDGFKDVFLVGRHVRERGLEPLLQCTVMAKKER